MTNKEIVSLMRVAFAQYPEKLAGLDGKNLAELWQAALGDLDYELAKAAVAMVVCKSPYPVRVSDVREASATLTGQVSLRTFDEAWALVIEAARDSAYHAAERYGELPGDIQAALHDASALREIGMADADDISVMKGQFRMAWEARVTRQRQMAMLPAGIRATIEQAAERLALGAPRLEAGKTAVGQVGQEA
jgi:hypothetical protein